MGAAGGGGKGGGGGGGGGSGGVSDFDFAMLQQAVGQNIEALQNRYKQLGLGVPGGDPLQAALGGTSLTYAGPSTMEMQDVAAQNKTGQAALGQLQASNVNTQFAPGSPANLAALAQQQQLASSSFGSIAGARDAAATGGGQGVPGGGAPLNIDGGGSGGNVRDTGTPAIG